MITQEHQITAEELYQTLKKIRVGGTVCQYSLRKCEEFVPLINEIRRLKEEKKAVVLAHSYVTPEIIYGVADYVGDSYALSKNAMEAECEIIVFAAVRFMGETAQILNPKKKVYIPGRDPGCTLADAIDAPTVRRLREEYPGYTFVCYINTTAGVKAECDICVTSSNVYDIVERYPNDKIYFLPDKLMGANLRNEMQKRGVRKDIQFFDGTCYVHEEYSPQDIFKIRTEYPDAKIVSHPECNEDVVNHSDFVGSTSQMLDYMEHSPARRFLMLTECGLSSRLQTEHPEKELVGSCTLCKYMKSNSLSDILRVLKSPSPQEEVRLDKDVCDRARKSIEAMFRWTKG